MTYRQIEFFHDDRHKVATSETLAYFTKLSGYGFPEDYRDFLYTVNGGRPWWGKNQVYLTCPKRIEIHNFFPFIRFELYTAQPGIWKTGSLRRPSFLFEIADLNDDRVIVMDLEQSRLGRIYVAALDPQSRTKITKDSSIDDVLADRRSLKVADSFSEFMDQVEVFKKTSNAKQGIDLNT